MTSALTLVERWLGKARPETALVLGSGLGRLIDRVPNARRLPYSEIPGFPASGVAGHAGSLVLAQFGDRSVLCQSGRFHVYEGHSPETIARPVRLFAALGIPRLILTNAAGGIAPRLTPGTLMLITDQINLTFRNPLHGTPPDAETRFPDMSAPFDPGLRKLAMESAVAGGIRLEQGTYAGVLGPGYETPAEIRMLRTLGADAVGMSTVLEVVTARALGLRTLAISVVTNRAAGLGTGVLSHEDVLEASAAAGQDLQQLLVAIVERSA